MWLCARNPLIKAAITRKPTFVSICMSIHANTTNKASIPMFSGSGITVFMLKSVYGHFDLLSQLYSLYVFCVWLFSSTELVVWWCLFFHAAILMCLWLCTQQFICVCGCACSCMQYSQLLIFSPSQLLSS